MTALLLAAAVASTARVLTLAGALATADANQPQLRSSRANAAIAGERAGESLAALLPRLDASAGVTWSAPSKTVIGLGGGTVSASAEWAYGRTYSAAISGSQTLFDLGAVARWRAAVASARAAEANDAGTRNLVREQVRLAFFSTRAAKELAKVAEDALANEQKHLATVAGFVNVGSRPEIDLATERGTLANARLDEIRAANAYETAKAELNQAMGVAGPTDFEVASETLPPVDGEDEGIDELVPLALASRPDLVAAERSITASELGIKAAYGDLAPAVTLSGRASAAGPALGDVRVGSPESTAVFSLNLSLPLFDGLANVARIRQAKDALAVTCAARETLAQQARLDLDRARLAVKAAKAEQGAAADSLTAAEEQLRLAEGRYQAGAGSILELNDAQLQQTRAAANVVQADFDLASARAQLMQALGRP